MSAYSHQLDDRCQAHICAKVQYNPANSLFTSLQSTPHSKQRWHQSNVVMMSPVSLPDSLLLLPDVALSDRCHRSHCSHFCSARGPRPPGWHNEPLCFVLGQRRDTKLKETHSVPEAPPSSFSFPPPPSVSLPLSFACLEAAAWLWTELSFSPHTNTLQPGDDVQQAWR